MIIIRYSLSLACLLILTITLLVRPALASERRYVSREPQNENTAGQLVVGPQALGIIPLIITACQLQCFAYSDNWLVFCTSGEEYCYHCSAGGGAQTANECTCSTDPAERANLRNRVFDEVVQECLGIPPTTGQETAHN